MLNPVSYVEALRIYGRAKELYLDYLYVDFKTEMAKASSLAREITALVPFGLYANWKTDEKKPRIYLVTFCGFERDTRIPVVGYLKLFGDMAGVSQSRPMLDELKGFLPPIDRLDKALMSYRGSRFNLLTPLSGAQIDILRERAGSCAEHKNFSSFKKYASHIAHIPDL